MFLAFWTGLELVMAFLLLVGAILVAFGVYHPDLQVVAVFAFLSASDMYFRKFGQDMEKIEARDALDSKRSV